MHTDSSAIRTCSASLSAVENTATVAMPSSRHARIIRIAIVPRFATSNFLNIEATSSGDFEDHQRLPVFYRISILDQYADHSPGGVGLDLVHHLHRLDDAQRLALAHLRPFLDEWGGIGRCCAIERPHHRAFDQLLIVLQLDAAGWRLIDRRRGELSAGFSLRVRDTFRRRYGNCGLSRLMIVQRDGA